MTTHDPLTQLIHHMRDHDIDALVLPRADQHQSEYLCADRERLAFITEFTGSAGACVIMARDTSAFFTDGRYTVQAKKQLDTTAFELFCMPEHTPVRWIARHTGLKDATIAFIPSLHTNAGALAIQGAARAAGARARALPHNPIDTLWDASGRPSPPRAPVSLHPPQFAGLDACEKLDHLRAWMTQTSCDALVLSAPESVCWTLNIRGRDTEVTPIVHAYLLLVRGSDILRGHLFIEPEKLSPDVTASLRGLAITPHPYEALLTALDTLLPSGAHVALDQASASYALTQSASAGPDRDVSLLPDPTLLMRARKNDVERLGAHNAHRRDAEAVVRFLHWLHTHDDISGVSEIDAAQQLLAFRAQQPLFEFPSFPSISAMGAHGAIIHYRPTPESASPLRDDTLYLIDSGGQYLDATTDITRTVCLGQPTPQMIRHYTLVLKGHIALSRARWPRGTTGHQLDVLARAALWQENLDYAHGTGHGVGSYMGVHEGPQSISTHHRDVPLEPGMILSNEPGYYVEDAYGIRIENLVIVTEDVAHPGWLYFDTLTRVPYCRRLIDTGLLSEQEIQWIDAYHADVLAILGEQLGESPQVRAWLIAQTRALV